MSDHLDAVAMAEILKKATQAVTDEFGSHTCYWTLVTPSRRICTLEISPICRCQQIARAVLDAVEYPSAPLAERQARLEAAQNEAERIIRCIRSTKWTGTEEIVQMIRRHHASRSRSGA